MLYFYRKGWSSGRLIIKDQTAEGEPQNMVLTSKQNGTLIEFGDDEFVKAKYPAFTFTEEEWAILFPEA